MYPYFFYPLLFFTTAFIAFQDFKERMVSLWLLALYFGNLAVFTYIEEGWLQVFENGIFSLAYFALCFSVLFCYYFFKERRLPQIIDSKIGKADLVIFLAIGLRLQPLQLILFFTLAFVLSLFITLLVIRDKKQVPLAGLLVIIYLIFDIFKSSIHLPTWN